MEKYLEDEYNVFEDENYLSREEEIEDYFKDCGREWLDCGQGYYQDQVTIICKVGNDFFKVSIEAELGSSKQDYGDRLYWVERIKYVNYEKIEKPKPKEKNLCNYKLLLTKEQQESLENTMKKLNINY